MLLFNSKALVLTLKRQQVHKTALAHISLVLLALCILSCGKRKPPVPPSRGAKQRVEITGSQQGNLIELNCPLPADAASKRAVNSVKRVDIYRLAELSTAPEYLTEEEFASRSTLIGSVNVGSEDIARKNIRYVDQLQFADQQVRLRYAIRFVNAAGQKASFSNFLLVEPSAKVAEPPRLIATEVSQDLIKVTWEPPAKNIDGTQPANILGYNLYRVIGDATKHLNAKPLTNEFFNDQFFEFEKPYSYFVRAVSVGKNGEPLESLDSNRLEILPKDTFPPSPPAGITVAASPNLISIFFANNPEKDIAGYRVFRSTDRNLPKTDWLSLTSELLKTNTFRDSKVESGKTYFYFVIAVDKFGNVSEASEVVTETVP